MDVDVDVGVNDGHIGHTVFRSMAISLAIPAYFAFRSTFLSVFPQTYILPIISIGWTRP